MMSIVRRRLARTAQEIVQPALATQQFDWAPAISIPGTAAPFENVL